MPGEHLRPERDGPGQLLRLLGRQVRVEPQLRVLGGEHNGPPIMDVDQASLCGRSHQREAAGGRGAILADEAGQPR